MNKKNNAEPLNKDKISSNNVVSLDTFRNKNQKRISELVSKEHNKVIKAKAFRNDKCFQYFSCSEKDMKDYLYSLYLSKSKGLIRDELFDDITREKFKNAALNRLTAEYDGNKQLESCYREQFLYLIQM